MVGADDIEVSKRFYDAVLGTLGYPSGHLDKKGRVWWRTETGVFGITKPIDGNKASHGNGSTIAFLVDSVEIGNEWHAAGIANGGISCEDPPGIRPNGYYLAYLRDPCGNKICALLKPE
tara:strand:+ start:1912 stop:2268 length:357 start_codon:yes stop_codon:yes gene_type:complete